MQVIEQLKKILNLVHDAEHAPTKEDASSSHSKIREIVGDLIEELGRKVSGRIKSEDDIIEIMQNCQVMNQRGAFLNPFDLKNEDFDAYVIVDSLSKTFRFWNQTELTVAEHCINLAQTCQESIKDPQEAQEAAKWALFHELFEAYTSDIATPVKAMLPEYKKAEDKALEKFATLAGVCPQMPTVVHTLDKRIMIDEALAYMPNEEYWLKKNTPIGIPMPKTPMEPASAKFLMAQTWLELGLPDIHGTLGTYIETAGREIINEHQRHIDELAQLTGQVLWHKKEAEPLVLIDQYGTRYDKTNTSWQDSYGDVVESEEQTLYSSLVNLSSKLHTGTHNVILTQDGSLFEEHRVHEIELENQNENGFAFITEKNNEAVYLEKHFGTEDYYEWSSLDDMLSSINNKLSVNGTYELEESEYCLGIGSDNKIAEFNQQNTDIKKLESTTL